MYLSQLYLSTPEEISKLGAQKQKQKETSHLKGIPKHSASTDT